MTMLDRMRRHKNWLKWSLILVCLAFVVFYIPDFLSPPTGDLAATDAVAIVDGREISGAEFQRTYQAQLGAYREAYGGNVSDQILRQLGIDQQILQQMIDERAALAEAERLDIRVSDEEVRQRILTLPALMENGAFIGEQRYLQLLNAQRPPVTPSDFEESLRRALAIDRLRSMVTGWLTIADDEIEQEYRRRNDKVKLLVASLPLDTFRDVVKASDEEVAAYFEAHQEEFRVPEKRKIRYALVDVDAVRLKTIVPDADVERAYNESFEQFSTPDEVRASHILLRTEGKDEAVVRALAEDILKQARAGTDFAQLATKYSEDATSAPNGGDLDFFSRGRMIPAFEETAFALAEGAIGDLVRTDFGFHIIKVTGKRAGTSRSLESVRPQLVEQLGDQRAQAEAADLGERLGAAVTDRASLDSAAAANGLTVQETEFFAPGDPIMGLGPAPDVAARVFAMAENEVSGVIPTARGPVVATLVGRQDSYLPKLDEVRENARAVVITQKATDLARQRAVQVLPRLRTASDFEAMAKTAGFQVETTELITRDSPIGQLGPMPEVSKVAFGLPAGSVSEPITSEAGAVVIKVVEKQEVSAADLAANKDRFREEMVAERRARLFAAYMAKARQTLQIQVNRQALQRILG
jgi:peptidyl-prolyl cis-trans isomerase D